MHEKIYDIRTGAVSAEYRTGSDLAPSDMPQPDQLQPKPPAFKTAFGWEGSPAQPSDAEPDPHDTPFEKTPSGEFEPLYGEGLPPNIKDGVPPGLFSATNTNFKQTVSQVDPHDVGTA